MHAQQWVWGEEEAWERAAAKMKRRRAMDPCTQWKVRNKSRQITSCGKTNFQGSATNYQYST